MSKINIGSSLDEFLAEEEVLEGATAVAVKRIISWQIEQEMKAQNLTKTAMARECTPAVRRSIACWMRLTPA